MKNFALMPNRFMSIGRLALCHPPSYLWQMTLQKVSDSSTGPISYINSTGDIVTVPAEQALYFDGGFWNIGSFHNYLSNPLSPATQTTEILGTGNYTIWNRGGSVAVSAGTATITGAGVATEGNPLHFTVTIAGTVNVTVSGDCTVFQLSGTKFSTEPFLSTSVSTVASRAGTIASPVDDALLYLLDGKAEGINELGAFYSKDACWTANSDGSYKCNGTGSLSFSLPHQTIGSYYEILVQVISYTSGSCRRVISSGNFTQDEIYYTQVKTYHDRAYVVNDSLLLKLYSISFYGTIKVISVTKISTPSIKLKFKLVPYFNHSGLQASTTKNILYSGTQPILQFRTDASGNGYIDLKDGTNTASVALNFEYGVLYDIEMLFGNNVSESANKMQLIVDSAASALVAFDGSLNPNTEVTIGKACDYLFFISKPTFYTLKQSDWR